MKIVNELLNNLISYTVNDYCDDDWGMFYEALTIVKKYNNPQNVNKQSIKKLINLISVVEDYSIKGIIIEIIVQYLC